MSTMNMVCACLGYPIRGFLDRTRLCNTMNEWRSVYGPIRLRVSNIFPSRTLTLDPKFGA